MLNMFQGACKPTLPLWKYILPHPNALLPQTSMFCAIRPFHYEPQLITSSLKDQGPEREMHMVEYAGAGF